MAYVHMGLGPVDTLAYRQFHTISGGRDRINDHSGCYGPVRPLLSAEDWEKAAVDLRKAGEESLDVEIEILDAGADVSISGVPLGNAVPVLKELLQIIPPNRESVPEHLPVDALQVKTYYFIYPQVNHLVDLLGGGLEAQLVEMSFKDGDSIEKVLRRAGLEYLDDFTLVSPRSLSVYDRIPAGAIRLLYLGAENFIRAIHLGLEQEIRQIEEALGQITHDG